MHYFWKVAYLGHTVYSFIIYLVRTTFYFVCRFFLFYYLVRTTYYFLYVFFLFYYLVRTTYEKKVVRTR